MNSDARLLPKACLLINHIKRCSGRFHSNK
jgi:hypothetical protein